MAGIGFELRRILKNDSYFGLLKGYTYAGIVASGPWVLSITGILLLGILAKLWSSNQFQIIQFQVSVTYLISFSLIITGFLQLFFTRFMADILFRKKTSMVVGILFLMIFFTTVLSGIFVLITGFMYFKDEPEDYLLLMSIGFIELANIWVLTIMASSIKDYKGLVFNYFVAYFMITVIGLLLSNYGLDGYLLAFDIGQAILFVGLFGLVCFQYPGTENPNLYSILKNQKLFYILIPTGFIFNAAIWADKIMFWFNPETSGSVIGPLRASPIYDVPIFLSYLLIIPGLAVFLMRLETDFVEAYNSFYDSIRNGGLLSEIISAKNDMINTARRGFIDIIKIQSVVIFITMTYSSQILSFLGYSKDYTRIFDFDIIGVSLQLLLMSILNVYFYLDRRGRVFFLVTIFLIGNIFFTELTLKFGPFYYGSGFMFSLLIVDLIGLYMINVDFTNLEYETFMKSHYG